MLYKNVIVTFAFAIAAFVIFPVGLVYALRGVKTIVPYPYDFAVATVVFGVCLYTFMYCAARWGYKQKLKPIFPKRREKSKKKPENKEA